MPQISICIISSPFVPTNHSQSFLFLMTSISRIISSVNFNSRRARCVRAPGITNPIFPIFWEFGSFSSRIPATAAHCSSCWTTRMINRSFRGINNIKNGTFPSLSIVSSIVYTTLMDLVNPGFEIFWQKPYLLYRRNSRRARCVPAQSWTRPINGGLPGVWEFQA